MSANLMTFAHFIDISGNKLAKLRRRHRHRYAAEIGKLGLECWIGEIGHSRLIDGFNDQRRNAFRRREAMPTACVVTRQCFRDRGYVGQDREPFRRADGQWPQLTRFNVTDRSRNGRKHHLNLTSDQIGVGIARVRHMNQFDTRHHLKQLAGDMRPGAYAVRRHIDLAWIGFGVGDEFRQGFGRQRRSDLQHVWHQVDARDRNDIGGEVEIQIFIKRRINGIGGSYQQ